MKRERKGKKTRERRREAKLKGERGIKERNKWREKKYG